MAAVPSEELRTVLWMFVILLTASFEFLNRSTCSKGPMKRAGKVCGDSRDLKSPGGVRYCIYSHFKGWSGEENLWPTVQEEEKIIALLSCNAAINLITNHPTWSKPPGHHSKGAITLPPEQSVCTKTLPPRQNRESKAPLRDIKLENFTKVSMNCLWHYLNWKA